MVCEPCKKRIVLWGFSNGECEICKFPIQTHHTPGYKLCDKCGEDNNLCVFCAK